MAKADWDSYESSWDFSSLPLVSFSSGSFVSATFKEIRKEWAVKTLALKNLEEEINVNLIDAYGLQGELSPGDKYE